MHLHDVGIRQRCSARSAGAARARVRVASRRRPLERDARLLRGATAARSPRSPRCQSGLRRPSSVSRHLLAVEARRVRGHGREFRRLPDLRSRKLSSGSRRRARRRAETTFSLSRRFGATSSMSASSSSSAAAVELVVADEVHDHGRLAGLLRGPARSAQPRFCTLTVALFPCPFLSTWALLLVPWPHTSGLTSYGCVTASGRSPNAPTRCLTRLVPRRPVLLQPNACLIRSGFLLVSYMPLANSRFAQKRSAATSSRGQQRSR